MNKTNKEKNTEHDKKELRPGNQRYDFTALEAAIRSWFK